MAKVGEIFFRFAVFHFGYVWALIVTARAPLIDPVSGIRAVQPLQVRTGRLDERKSQEFERGVRLLETVKALLAPLGL